MFPTDAVIAVTYRCNARCTMCDIWKSDSSPAIELKPNDLRIAGDTIGKQLSSLINSIKKTITK